MLISTFLGKKIRKSSKIFQIISKIRVFTRFFKMFISTFLGKKIRKNSKIFLIISKIHISRQDFSKCGFFDLLEKKKFRKIRRKCQKNPNNFKISLFGEIFNNIDFSRELMTECLLVPMELLWTKKATLSLRTRAMTASKSSPLPVSLSPNSG